MAQAICYRVTSILQKALRSGFWMYMIAEKPEQSHS